MKNDNRKLFHSQNFLKDPAFVENLINKADIDHNDSVVEIGPGKGIITKILAEKAGRVIAVEVEEKLYTKLKDKFKDRKNVKIIKADFLKWQLPSSPYKVFSNIPFNLTTFEKQNQEI